MNRTIPSRQGGFSFNAFIVWIIILVLGSIMGLKLAPSYIENQKIKSIFVTIAHDPDMQKGTPRDIRTSYDRRSVIDGIKAVKSADIQVEKDGERWILSASYTVLIPLAGNVSWFLEFNPSSEQ